MGLVITVNGKAFNNDTRGCADYIMQVMYEEFSKSVSKQLGVQVSAESLKQGVGTGTARASSRSQGATGARSRRDGTSRRKMPSVERELINRDTAEVASKLGLEDALLFETAKGMAEQAFQRVLELAKWKWKNVTGNLWKSLGYSIYCYGHPFYTRTTDGPEPTRPSLKKGEKYDLPYYYGGRKVGKKPYVGTSMERNYSAEEEVRKKVYSWEGKRGIEVQFFLAMPYAEYVRGTAVVYDAFKAIQTAVWTAK